jgi:hypothetical protein
METKQTTLIVLPLDGAPYILSKDFVEGAEGSLEKLQSAVGGYFEAVAMPKERVVIHPMFSKECISWRQAGKLIKKAPKTYLTLWCNENGIRECSPNMAVFVKCTGGYRQLMGQLVIQANTKWFNKNKKNYMGIYDSKEAMIASYDDDSDDSE